MTSEKAGRTAAMLSSKLGRSIAMTGGGYSLMVHGGAGAVDELDDPVTASPYLTAIEGVLAQGRALLASGTDALDVVEACAAMLEDEPLFNAGRGSVLNEAGRVEMDAAVMDGRDLTAGAVAAVHGIANPVRLARLLMNRGRHVMLVGEGAMQFADRCGMSRVTEDYFLLAARVAQLERARRRRETMSDQDAHAADAGPQGTIGAIARDIRGNLAAATSTGGMVDKLVGRVGDSPIIGAGVYADNATCAVSATGRGEDLMRSVLAKTIADYIGMRGLDSRQATRAGIDYLGGRLRGQGGVIVIDLHGNCSSGSNTRHMIHGWIEHGAEAVVRF